MTPFLETFSGHTFAPLRPKFSDIRIEDIAHALAQQCRFSGHVRFHYSVAEHSVRVSEYLHETPAWRSALWGLLHDAAEAYLVDLPSPIKQSAEFAAVYQPAEAKIMAAVCRRFGLSQQEPAAVRQADARLLATEVRDLMHGDRPYWAKLTERPLSERIRPWAPAVAEYEFLRMYRLLTGDER